MCKVNIDQPNALYVNPMTDFGFKKIFGDEEVMMTFLNDLLKSKSPIVHITFVDKEMLPDNLLERGVIYDMRCKTEDGGEFIVEMQNRGQIHFSERIIYYLSRSIAPQGDKGLVEIEDGQGKKKKVSWDFELQPVYGVFFMNFHLKQFEPHLLRTVKFLVEETKEEFCDKVRAYTIELPCLNKTEEECTEDIEYWSYIMNNMETLQTQMPFTDKKPIFAKIGELASLANMPIAERETYQRSLDQYRSTAATYVYEHQQGFDEGVEIGKAKGIEIGEAKGIEIGKAKGIEIGEAKGIEIGKAKGIEIGEAKGIEIGETNKAIAIARNMKEAGVNDDVISKCTGLSGEEINAL